MTRCNQIKCFRKRFQVIIQGSIYLMILQQNWFWSVTLLPPAPSSRQDNPPTSPLTPRPYISRSLAATLASSLRMANVAPCWRATKAFDPCGCKHRPQLLLLTGYQPAELFWESCRRGNGLGSGSAARQHPSLLLGGPATPC